MPGLIFQKYFSDAFGELHQKLVEGKGEYEKVFYVPPSTRWKCLQGRAKLPTIGKDVDDAMEAIEKDNPASLRACCPGYTLRKNWTSRVPVASLTSSEVQHWAPGKHEAKMCSARAAEAEACSYKARSSLKHTTDHQTESLKNRRSEQWEVQMFVGCNASRTTQRH